MQEKQAIEIIETLSHLPEAQFEQVSKELLQADKSPEALAAYREILKVATSKKPPLMQKHKQG